jgi:hypothetical protein
MAAGGVLAHPSGFNPTLAHTQADIEETIRALNVAPR